MNGSAELYRSPSSSSFVAGLENILLSADDSWWTGRHPLNIRVVAEVPLALYLNYVARKSYVASLSPSVFRPLDVAGETDATLFTVLMFAMERARPMSAPRILGAIAPRIMQSNWRFYGQIKDSESESRSAVLFLRTVTTSFLLSAFGRRLARCFPLRRAHSMTLDWAGHLVTAAIEPGVGSAPELFFEGEATQPPAIGHDFHRGFASYEEYARWIIDQHLSVAIWPREHVVQDMHLDFQEARITPLRCLACRVSGLQHFVPDASKPVDCFVVEKLTVFLDNIYAVSESSA